MHKHMKKFGFLAFLFVGCIPDGNQTKLQYMPDMADSPAVKAQLDYLDPPEGSIATNAIFYAKDSTEAEGLFKNPFLGRPNEEADRRKGKDLYLGFCTPCHGTGAKGDGSVTDKYPKPPDLTTLAYQKRQDGFFYHTITKGVRNMPGYGHSITSDERWRIVLHLRKLQGIK